MSDELFNAALRRCERTGRREQGIIDDEHGRTYWTMRRDPDGTLQLGFAGNLEPGSAKKRPAGGPMP